MKVIKKVEGAELLPNRQPQPRPLETKVLQSDIMKSFLPSVRREMEYLLYTVSSESLPLNRVKPHYEQFYSKPLDYRKFNCSKFIQFLELFGNSIVVRNMHMWRDAPSFSLLCVR